MATVKITQDMVDKALQELTPLEELIDLCTVMESWQHVYEKPALYKALGQALARNARTPISCLNKLASTFGCEILETGRLEMELLSDPALFEGWSGKTLLRDLLKCQDFPYDWYEIVLEKFEKSEMLTDDVVAIARHRQLTREWALKFAPYALFGADPERAPAAAHLLLDRYPWEDMWRAMSTKGWRYPTAFLSLISTYKQRPVLNDDFLFELISPLINDLPALMVIKHLEGSQAGTKMADLLYDRPETSYRPFVAGLKNLSDRVQEGLMKSKSTSVLYVLAENPSLSKARFDKLLKKAVGKEKSGAIQDLVMFTHLSINPRLDRTEVAWFIERYLQELGRLGQLCQQETSTEARAPFEASSWKLINGLWFVIGRAKWLSGDDLATIVLDPRISDHYRLMMSHHFEDRLPVTIWRKLWDRTHSPDVLKRKGVPDDLYNEILMTLEDPVQTERRYYERGDLKVDRTPENPFERALQHEVYSEVKHALSKDVIERAVASQNLFTRQAIAERAPNVRYVREMLAGDRDPMIQYYLERRKS